MSKNEKPEPTTPTRGTTRIKTSVMKCPEELPAKFNPLAAEEFHVQGVVATADIRALLDTFGLSERKHFAIPFQEIDKRGMEIWSLRIEDVASHVVDGVPMVGHQWQYRRERPELTSAAA